MLLLVGFKYINKICAVRCSNLPKAHEFVCKIIFVSFSFCHTQDSGLAIQMRIKCTDNSIGNQIIQINVMIK
jgi:hypothetical protein